MHFSISRALAALVATVALAAPLGASASGGVRIIVTTWSPASPAAQNDAVVLDRPNLLENGLNAGWAKARGPICAELEKELGAPNLAASGVTLYDMTCTLAQSGTLTVTGASGHVVTLDYRLPGNSFKTKATQPTIVGSEGNPCVFVDYDLDATTTVHLDTLAVDTFRASIVNVSRPDSCDAVADIAKFAATTFHFFGGPDFLARAQDALTIHKDVMTAPLDAAVASFVEPLDGYASAYATQASWVRHGDLFFAFAPRYAPAVSSDVLAGTIDMPKARYSSPIGCGSFSITGTVQTGPAPVLDPETLRRGSAPTVDMGVISAPDPALDDGDKFSCAYVERQLPAGVPVAFEARGPVRTADHPYITVVGPEGWSGVQTLAPGTPQRNFVANSSSLQIYSSVLNTPSLAAIKASSGPDPRYGQISPAQSVSAAANPQVRELNPQPLPPAGTNPLVASGNLAFRRADFAGAASRYGQAVAAHPADAIALYDLALAHARLGQTQRAKGELQQAGSLARAAGDAATANVAATSIIIVGGRGR